MLETYAAHIWRARDSQGSLILEYTVTNDALQTVSLGSWGVVKNITSVTYGDEAGTALGMFVQTGPTAWVEKSLPDMQDQFFFEEVVRYGSSIYVFDESGPVYIQLDLQSNVINYEDNSQVIEPLYFILEYEGQPNAFEVTP